MGSVNHLGGVVTSGRLRTLAAVAATLTLAVTIAPAAPSAAGGATTTHPARTATTAAAKAKPLVTATAVFYNLDRARFSPNGDGHIDQATVRYTLRLRSHVVATVRDSKKRVLRVVDLGTRRPGRSGWLWDGKTKSGRIVPDGLYTIRFTAKSIVPRKHRKQKSVRGAAVVRAEARTTFTPSSKFSPLPPTVTFGSRTTLYPDTTYFTDTLRWTNTEFFQADDESDPSVSTIQAADGSVVWDNRGNPNSYQTWAGTDLAGGRVPDGAYTLSTTWQDAFGNPFVVSNAIRVAPGSYVEVHYSVTLTAADALDPRTPTASYDHCFEDHDGRYCEPWCPPTASARFADGLTFHRGTACMRSTARFQVDTPYELDSTHDTVRIGTTGGPTTAGGADTAYLDLPVPPFRVVLQPADTTTTIQSTPYAGPFMRGDPSLISWTVSVADLDSYDVSGFTVDLVHYEPPA